MLGVRAYLIANCLVVACVALGCGGDDAENAEVTGVGNDDDDGGTTGDESNSSNASASTTSVTTSTSSSTTASTSTSTSTTTTTTTTTTDPVTSTTDDSETGCPVGDEGCACNGDGECNGSLVCLGDICGEAGECGVDLFESNNTEENAADLGDIGDADDDGGTLTAVLDGPEDVDWFFYDGSDDIVSSVDPTRTLTTVGGLRLCKYAECVNGLLETEVTCPEGTAMATSPDNRPGCCGDDGFEVELNCQGVVSDDARVYLRVDQAQQECVQYTLDYHY